TNKAVCRLRAEFIPARRATGRNHRLTVGQASMPSLQGVVISACALCRVAADHPAARRKHKRRPYRCGRFCERPSGTNIIPVFQTGANLTWSRLKDWHEKKRGNPNWGKPDLHSTARIQANSFEEIVRKLRLLPEQYVNSVQLKDWVRKNMDQKYVPSDLLKAWDFETVSDF